MFKKVKIIVKDKTYMQMLCNKIIEQNSDEKFIALASSLLFMKIYSKENSLSVKGFIYIIVLSHGLICQGGHSTKRFRELLTSCPQSIAESHKCIDASARLAFSTLHSPGFSGQENVLTHN